MGLAVLPLPRGAAPPAPLRFPHLRGAWISLTRSRLAALAREPALPPRARAALWAQAAAKAGVLLDEEAARLGVRYAGLRIRDPRSRWGSCGPDGHIMLSLRLAMAPLEVFRYVAVHELCHLRWRGHGKRFWEMVGRQLPDFREHRAWLRRNGNTLQRVPLVG
jgi:predicted metal-dependent hydrolase